MINKISYSLDNGNYRNNNIKYPIKNEYLDRNIFHTQNADLVSFNGISVDTFIPGKIIMKNLFDRSVMASRRFFTSLIPDLDGKISEVSLKTKDGLDILAWDMNPINSKKYVIFLHGTSQNISHNQPLYSQILKTDFGLLTPEYRSFGKNKLTEINDKNIIHDVEAALDYLKHKNINPKNIGVIGHSMGSYPAIKLAEKNPDLNFLILVSPISSLTPEANNLMRGNKIQIPNLIKKLVKQFPFLLNTFSKNFNTPASLSQTTVPTYFIHSDTDTLIHINQSQKLSKHASNLIEFIRLPQGGHRMEESKIATVVNIIKGKNQTQAAI